MPTHLFHPLGSFIQSTIFLAHLSLIKIAVPCAPVGDFAYLAFIYLSCIFSLTTFNAWFHAGVVDPMSCQQIMSASAWEISSISSLIFSGWIDPSTSKLWFQIRSRDRVLVNIGFDPSKKLCPALENSYVWELLVGLAG